MSTLSPSSSFDPLFAFLAYSLSSLETAFYQLPGSAVIARYVKSSHQNDPGRTLLELILVVFAIRTLLQSRTRNEKQQKHFIEFNEKEIDELVNEWTPEPLSPPLTTEEKVDLASISVIAGPNTAKPKLTKTAKPALNLASYNFTGLAGNEHIKSLAIDTLRRYGLGSCGPSGFYGTIDVHTKFEETVASFLGTEAAILYAQSMATTESVIPAFCKRGDLIIADKHCNFAIRKGIEISRANVKWFEHNDLASLEEVLMSVEKEEKRRLRRRGCLSRMLGFTSRKVSAKYIVTEGIFERDGAMVDLPKLIELKQKYKYRLILEESMSFGTVGRTGRGLTELYNVPATKIDMIVASAAIGLGAGGGFCAGNQAVIDHQRSNGMAFVFSASLPALLAVSATEAIHMLSSTPSILESLQENTRTARAILDKVDGITIPSHAASPLIHLQLKEGFWRSSLDSPEGTPTPNKNSLHPSSALSTPMLSIKTRSTSTHGSSKQTFQSPLSVPHPSPSQITFEEGILQEIVDEALVQGVFLTRAKRLRGHEVNEPKPSIKLSISGGNSGQGGGGLTKKEIEKACGVIKAAVAKVAARRR